MSISFNGLSETVATFQAEGELQKGDPVVVTDTNTVSKAASGNFIGFVLDSKGGYCSVKLSGYHEARFAGDALPFGLTKVAYNTKNALIPSETGVEVKVFVVDTSKNVVGFCF